MYFDVFLASVLTSYIDQAGKLPAYHIDLSSMRIVPITTPSARQQRRLSTRVSVPSYSVGKLIALHDFIATASPWRVLWLLCATPIPGLLSAVLPAFVPLQDPLSAGGVMANPGYIVHAITVIWLCFTGMLLHYRAGAKLPTTAYTFSHILGVATIGTAIQIALDILLALVWTFPLPMTWVIGASLIGVSLSIPHLVLFGKRCWQDTTLRDGFKRYLPALLFQCCQIVVYPAFSVVFDRASSTMQVVLTLAFPFVKYTMKRLLRHVTGPLAEFETEVTVSGIEICASLYQSMIMQNSPSTAAITIIMAADVLQGLATVKLFMDKHVETATPRHLIVQAALDEVRTSSMTLAPLLHLKQTPVVAQALHIVDVAESIVLVEYFEVVIPLVHLVFVAVSQQLSSAQYNMRLRELYFHPELFTRAVSSILLYVGLQSVSFIAMHWVMKHRYGLSATYQLAFVLEYHWQSIVGKMVAWLPIILHFTVIHYGVDFSFQFDFAKMLADTGPGTR